MTVVNHFIPTTYTCSTDNSEVCEWNGTKNVPHECLLLMLIMSIKFHCQPSSCRETLTYHLQTSGSENRQAENSNNNLQCIRKKMESKYPPFNVPSEALLSIWVICTIRNNTVFRSITDWIPVEMSNIILGD